MPRGPTVLPVVSPSSVPPYCVYLVLYLQAVGAARPPGVVAWRGNLDTNPPGARDRQGQGGAGVAQRSSFPEWLLHHEVGDTQGDS